MNEEQSEKLIEVLKSIDETLKNKKIEELNKKLKEFIPDEWERKIEGNKTFSKNIGVINRRKLINKILEV